MWVYVQRTGAMYRADGSLAWTGYSGQGEGLNNPAMQSVHDVGPIPCGDYTMQPPYDSKNTGVYSIALMPDAETETFGRDGASHTALKAHGDNGAANHTASHGCIVKSPKRERMLLWDSGDHRVRVVAEEADRHTV